MTTGPVTVHLTVENRPPDSSGGHELTSRVVTATGDDFESALAQARAQVDKDAEREVHVRVD